MLPKLPGLTRQSSLNGLKLRRQSSFIGHHNSQSSANNIMNEKKTLQKGAFTFKKMDEENANSMFAEDDPSDKAILEKSSCSFAGFNSLIKKSQIRGSKRSRSMQGRLKGILNKNDLKRKIKRRKKAR